MKKINVNGQEILINDQDFTLVTNPKASYEDYGWSQEGVEYLLDLAANETEDDRIQDPEDLNTLGIMFTEGVGVELNMELGISFFERAIEEDDDLARSNLADIYRKGTNGTPENHAKAFALYQACKLPYAFYRVGEYYENGKAGEINLEEAKRFYRIAYKAGHGLAKRKLQSFNFLAE